MRPMQPFRSASRFLPVLGGVLAAACADPNLPADGALPAALPARALQALECEARIAGSVRCGAPGAATGAASAVIYGGQNVFVTLQSSNFSLVDGTFSFDVTVQNLLNEAIGTPDGVTPHPDGIRVFFTTAPVASAGAGEVGILNADGAAFFTEAEQAYFGYPQILEKDVVSAAKTWQFSVDAGVSAFRFRVMIETEVQPLLVINELLANPGGTISDAVGEWFELFNAGTLPVELQGLAIADSALSGRRPFHIIATSIVVPSGGYVVLGNSTNTTLNGGVPVDYSYGSALGFANSIDALKISRVVGGDTLTLDRTQYASGAISAQNGVSRELKNPVLNNADMDGSNWGDALATAVYGPGGRGTPGAQNSVFTP
jgi:hypothetical protein